MIVMIVIIGLLCINILITLSLYRLVYKLLDNLISLNNDEGIPVVDHDKKALRSAKNSNLSSVIETNKGHYAAMRGDIDDWC